MTENVNNNFARMRERLFDDALYWICIAAVPGVLLSLSRVLIIGWQPVMLVHGLVLAGLWFVWLGRTRIPYRLRVTVLLIFVWLVTYAGLLQFGLAAISGMYSILFACIAILFLKRRPALMLIAGNFLCLALLGWAASQHWLSFRLDYQMYTHHPLVWLNYVWNLTAYSVIFVLIVGRMIQGVREREAQAQSLEQMQRDILESIPDAVVLINSAGIITLVNGQTLALFGYTREELVGASVDILLPERLRGSHVHQRLGYLSNPTQRPIGAGSKVLAITRDGREFPADVSLGPVHTRDGLMVVATLRDVSERRRSEEILKRYQFIANSVTDMMTLISRDHRYEAVNDAWCGKLEKSREEVVGRHLSEIWGEEVYQQSIAPRLERCIAEAQPQHLGASVRLPSLGLRECEITYFPYEEVPGQISHVVVVTRDVTSKLAAERELLEAKQAAEAASQAKSSFLASMSHELRTPLNAIIGFTQMLEMGVPVPLEASQKESVGHVLNSGRHLLRLINEVLDLARIESGRVDLLMTTVPLDLVIAEAVTMVGSMATPRRIALRPACPEGLSVQADAARLGQILLNLLSNAVKYNHDEGLVVIYCQARGDRVRISVVDTGPGIPESRQEELFLPFHRLGAERTSTEGTGIGLVISKKLAESMGGSMGFESEVGIGSRFWLELAAAVPAQDSPGLSPLAVMAPSSPDLVRGRVLYVEDNPVNLSVMEFIFQKLPGVELLTAESAEVGLQLIREHQPDLVLMDISLPGMNGLEALQAIKADPDIAAIPVIAVSAAALPGDVAAGLEAGFLAYFTKPFDVDTLLSRIHEVLRSARGESHGA